MTLSATFCHHQRNFHLQQIRTSIKTYGQTFHREQETLEPSALWDFFSNFLPLQVKQSYRRKDKHNSSAKKSGELTKNKTLNQHKQTSYELRETEGAFIQSSQVNNRSSSFTLWLPVQCLFGSPECAKWMSGSLFIVPSLGLLSFC